MSFHTSCWAAGKKWLRLGAVVLGLVSVTGATASPAKAAVVPVTDGLVVWLKADAITGYSHGDVVTTWYDSAGTGTGIGDNLSQDAAVVAGGPTYDTVHTINGLPTVRFGGGGAYQYAGSLGIGGQQAFTVFLVSTSEQSISRAFQIGDIDNGVNDGEGGRSVGFDVSTDASGFRFNNGNRLFSEAFGSQAHIGMWRMTSTSTYGTAEYARDGFLGTQQSVANPSYVIDLLDEGYSVGAGVTAGGSLSDFLSGNLAEILFYNRALTDQEVNAVGFYLATKYGLETNYVPEPGTGGLLLLGATISLVAFQLGRRCWWQSPQA